METQISETNNQLAKLAYQQVSSAVEHCGTIDLAELIKYEAEEVRRLAKIGLYLFPIYKHDSDYPIS